MSILRFATPYVNMELIAPQINHYSRYVGIYISEFFLGTWMVPSDIIEETNALCKFVFTDQCETLSRGY